MLRCIKYWRSGAGILAVLSLPAAAAPAEFTPFRAPNLSPPVAIIGLPLWSDVPDATTFGFTTEVANHFRLSSRAGDSLVLDGETLRIRGHLEHPFAENWSVGIDLPYVHQSGGVLDDLVDGWHSLLSLPDGSRNLRLEGVLDYDLANQGGSFFQLDDSGSGLGDLQLSLARRLGGDDGWVVRAAVKLPTGEERLLAGSGSTDFTLSALTIQQGNVRGRSAAYFFGGALVDFGQPDNVRYPAEDRSLAAVIGGAISLRDRIGIKGQLDVYSAIYDSQLEEIGQSAVQASLGGWLSFGETGLFEFAISEDLHVSTTPDVVFFFNLTWRHP